MRIPSIFVAASALATAIVAGPLAEPAGAAVTTSTSGTVLTVNMTGDGDARFGCDAGKVTVTYVVALPALNCSALTQVNVTGDGGNQTVNGSLLNGAEFSAGPRLLATMGDGIDSVTETRKADQIDTGPGGDNVVLAVGGLANTSVGLGTGLSDSLYLYGSSSPEAMSVFSTTSGTVTITTTRSATTTATGVEWLTVDGDAGNDTITGTLITAASGLTSTTFHGGLGDDQLRAGVKGANMFGGPGTNTMLGNTGPDGIWSASETDIVDVGADTVQSDTVYDEASLHSGGRTIAPMGTNDVYSVLNPRGDSVYRVRPGPGASEALATTSLTRSGQQILPPTLPYIVYSAGFVAAPAHRVILDVVATAKRFTGGALPTDTVLLDVTVPTGSWTVTTGDAYVAIDPTAAGLADVSATKADAYKVHGPWTGANKTKGFVHRLTRDLMFRFSTDANRDLVASRVTAGTTTRAGVATSLIDTDEYRGLDVDRVFLAFLRRTSDPSGRTYWINRLREGRGLTRFRAQLFGGGEYFAKAGGTNRAYVAKAYADVLGRAPDVSGLAFWTGRLDGGADRGSVALEFLSSFEARRTTVREQFLRFLDRQPTATEISTWVPRLAEVDGETDLIAFLGASTAYFDRS